MPESMQQMEARLDREANWQLTKVLLATIVATVICVAVGAAIGGVNTALNSIGITTLGGLMYLLTKNIEDSKRTKKILADVNSNTERADNEIKSLRIELDSVKRGKADDKVLQAERDRIEKAVAAAEKVLADALLAAAELQRVATEKAPALELTGSVKIEHAEIEPKQP